MSRRGRRACRRCWSSPAVSARSVTVWVRGPVASRLRSRPGRPGPDRRGDLARLAARRRRRVGRPGPPPPEGVLGLRDASSSAASWAGCPSGGASCGAHPRVADGPGRGLARRRRRRVRPRAPSRPRRGGRHDLDGLDRLGLGRRRAGRLLRRAHDGGNAAPTDTAPGAARASDSSSSTSTSTAADRACSPTRHASSAVARSAQLVLRLQAPAAGAPVAGGRPAPLQRTVRLEAHERGGGFDEVCLTVRDVAASLLATRSQLVGLRLQRFAPTVEIGENPLAQRPGSRRPSHARARGRLDHGARVGSPPRACSSRRRWASSCGLPHGALPVPRPCGASPRRLPAPSAASGRPPRRRARPAAARSGRAASRRSRWSCAICVSRARSRRPRRHALFQERRDSAQERRTGVLVEPALRTGGNGRCSISSGVSADGSAARKVLGHHPR